MPSVLDPKDVAHVVVAVVERELPPRVQGLQPVAVVVAEAVDEAVPGPEGIQRARRMVLEVVREGQTAAVRHPGDPVLLVVLIPHPSPGRVDQKLQVAVVVVVVGGLELPARQAVEATLDAVHRIVGEGAVHVPVAHARPVVRGVVGDEGVVGLSGPVDAGRSVVPIVSEPREPELCVLPGQDVPGRVVAEEDRAVLGVRLGHELVLVVVDPDPRPSFGARHPGEAAEGVVGVVGCFQGGVSDGKEATRRGVTEGAPVLGGGPALLVRDRDVDPGVVEARERVVGVGSASGPPERVVLRPGPDVGCCGQPAREERIALVVGPTAGVVLRDRGDVHGVRGLHVLPEAVDFRGQHG